MFSGSKSFRNRELERCQFIKVMTRRLTGCTRAVVALKSTALQFNKMFLHLKSYEINRIVVFEELYCRFASYSTFDCISWSRGL